MGFRCGVGPGLQQRARRGSRGNGGQLRGAGGTERVSRCRQRGELLPDRFTLAWTRLAAAIDGVERTRQCSRGRSPREQSSWVLRSVKGVIDAAQAEVEKLRRVHDVTTAPDIAARIFSLPGRMMEGDESGGDETSARAARRLSGDIAARAKHQPRKLLPLFDVQGEAPPDAFELLVALAAFVDGPTVIFAGVDPERLPPQAAPYSMHEALGPLSMEGEGDDYNRRVIDAVREVVYASLRAAP